MRAVFGLGGILIVLGVIVYIMGGKNGELAHDKAAIDAGHKATEQFSQTAGRDSNGNPVKQSATLEPQSSAGTITGVLVTGLQPDSPYAKFWGLKRSDLITETGPLPVKGNISDVSAADDYVMTAYQNRWSLTIVRDGQKMTLDPIESTPAAAGKPKGNSLQDQLNGIQDQAVPTH